MKWKHIRPGEKARLIQCRDSLVVVRVHHVVRMPNGVDLAFEAKTVDSGESVWVWDELDVVPIKGK